MMLRRSVTITGGSVSFTEVRRPGLSLAERDRQDDHRLALERAVGSSKSQKPKAGRVADATKPKNRPAAGGGKLTTERATTVAKPKRRREAANA